jgi:hypothetical protein
VIKEQYHIAKYAHVSFLETNLMCDFEREAFISFIVEDLQRKQKEYSK